MRRSLIYYEVNTGFSLVEVMVYLGCTTVLLVFVFGWVVQQTKDCMRVRQALHQGLYEQLVRDVMRRDFIGASRDVRDYDIKNRVFKKYWLDRQGRKHSAWIGYKVASKGIARYQGMYNPITGVWVKRSISYLPACFDHLEFSYILDEQMAHVQCIVMIYDMKQGSNQQMMTDRYLIKNRVEV